MKTSGIFIAPIFVIAEVLKLNGLNGLKCSAFYIKLFFNFKNVRKRKFLKFMEKTFFK